MVEIREVKFSVQLDDTEVEIRIELLEDCKEKHTFKARVYRLENYRIQPTFPQKKGKPSHKPCDEKLWVEDNFLWISEDKFSAKNSKEAFEKVFKIILNKLGC